MDDARAKFANISGAATTVVKSGAGTLHRLTINKPVAASTITVYNNTAGSGAKIATITNPAGAGQPYYIDYIVRFDVGLTIITSGADDVTAVYQ